MSSEPAVPTTNPQRIERLRVHAFRNIATADISPGPAFNVISGDNGAGKTSLLEAIHYLGSLRSFRSAKTDDLIGLGHGRSAFEARVTGDVVPRSFRVELSRQAARKVTLDGKRPRSTATWRSAIQTVLFYPGHLQLAAGGAESRRAFMDHILERVDPSYSNALTSYEKALRSRNRLLKQEGVDPRSIRAFDAVLCAAGAVVGRCRARLASDLAPLVERAFEEVVGEHMPLRLRYEPKVEPLVERLQRALEESLAKDLARGFTGSGPHADDMALEVVDRAPVRHHASQGQHRVMALALKMAEVEILSRTTGRVPILLLDDVTSELDRTRNRRFFDLLSRQGGQVFLTTTHPDFILLNEARVDLEVTEGAIESLSRQPQ